MLRSQDILILLKLALWGRVWTFDQIAHELGLSASAVHRSLDRAAAAGLYRPAAKEVDKRALEEFLVHGVRTSFRRNGGVNLEGSRPRGPRRRSRTNFHTREITRLSGPTLTAK